MIISPRRPIVLLSSALLMVSVLAGCLFSASVKDKPPPPPPRVRVDGGVSDGHSWTVFRYIDGSQRCVSIVDETEAQSGSACGDDELRFGFKQTMLWVVTTSVRAREARLELDSERSLTVSVTNTGLGWPVGYAIFEFPINAAPVAIVEIGFAGEQLRRIPCEESGCRS